MSKFRIRNFGPAQGGIRPELPRADVAPYPSRGYRHNPQGLGSLFVQGDHRKEEDDYRRLHGWDGGNSMVGLKSIKLLNDAGKGNDNDRRVGYGCL